MKQILVKFFRILNQSFFSAISIAMITVSINLFTSLALLAPSGTELSSVSTLFIWCGIVLSAFNFAFSTIIVNEFNKAPERGSATEIENHLKTNLSLCTILLWLVSFILFLITIKLLLSNTL